MQPQVLTQIALPTSTYSVGSYQNIPMLTQQERTCEEGGTLNSPPPPPPPPGFTEFILLEGFFPRNGKTFLRP
jgi:hypothetical protein